MRESLKQFRERAAELAHLESVQSALAWDQETIMPPRGAGHRARQRASLASIHHQKLTDPVLGELLQELDSRELPPILAISVDELKRKHERAAKVPSTLVKELAETTALAYEEWVEARKRSDFAVFAPWLKRVFQLKQKEAACLDADGKAYETLLDDFEPGMTEEQIERIFSALQPKLTELVEKVVSSTGARMIRSWEGHFPVQKQQTLGRAILTSMGFDWEAGRMDVSHHPFCVGLTPLDVRITTRYSEEDFSGSLFGMIHECGHALYEQGLDLDLFELPICQSISLGIHESQSRLWENQIARSAGFWSHWFPVLQKAFPDQFCGFTLRDFVRAINRVAKTPIRVEADEVTYGLHIILRFEIERDLLRGELEVDELPEHWNSRMREYLDIVPENDAQGVLQDTHWSQGLIGYFPTYLLGNLYAAQLFHQARLELPDLNGEIEQGNLLPLRQWLRERVHRVGRQMKAPELIESVTGEQPSNRFFVDYLSEKYSTIFEFQA